MPRDTYDFAEIEPEMLSFWKENGIHRKANEQADGEPFYFLDGPPYTSGSVHIGTAWNKSMKDAVLRFRRMQGRAVWDRAGYDMHGLPNEHGAMEDLGLKNKEEILEYGLDRFIAACRERAVKNLQSMNADFERLGVWMDFEEAYQTISDEWIDAVWWLVKKAYGDGRLYEGLRPMYWDPTHESALAKHELFYRTVEDESIYVKFPRTDADDEHFLIWTTTPWTIPFNLMIMVNPEVTYVRVRIDDEVWIVAEDCLSHVLERAGVEEKEAEILERLSGDKLVGLGYEHFFADELDYASLKKDHPNVHTIVASKEYVTTESGTGLVHGAPGCGPEDYEVGVREDVPAWNLLDEQGRFPKDAGVFAGRRARFEDAFFTQRIEERGMLVAKEPYVHDYPHAERSKQPIVYKTTKQWFFKIADLKEQMVAQNKDVHWMPEAGFNAFNSWLENLRDNSITKQRFWGTPFPVWRNEEDPEDVIVVGSKEELQELAGIEIADPHKPWIDDVTIERDGKTYRRIPDVIDVWVDAGVASWACLRFPQQQELFDKYFPSDFIIEGNDQVRGWFNLLMVASTLAFGKAPFKNVYMHGMINDAKGRKMSKSEGNYILPEEVIGRYGADAFRLYAIGGTKAGQDLNYNFADCETKHKNLLVYWNIHKYLLDLSSAVGRAPEELSGSVELQAEDRYILSRTHSTVRRVSELLDEYRIDRIPQAIEDLLGDVSRTYIQLVRPIVSAGTPEEQGRILDVLWHAYGRALRLLAPITPFITEAIWQNLRVAFGREENSVHLLGLPEAEEGSIDTELERRFADAERLISVILAARDKAQIGVRWPLAHAEIVGIEALSNELQELVRRQTNVKEVVFAETLDLAYTVKPNYRAIGKEFGQDTADIAADISARAAELGAEFKEEGKVTAAGKTLGAEFLDLEAHAPEGFAHAEDKELAVLLSLEQPQELLEEGYFRELARRVQQLRKEADLDKTDRIHLILAQGMQEWLAPFTEELAEIVGAEKVDFAADVAAPHTAEAKVKDRSFSFGFFRADDNA